MLTWAEINLDAISHNLRQIKSLVEPKGAKILAVVKDNAYGHGALEVAHIAENENVSMFGVATVEEAIHLRQEGIKKPILVFCCILPEQAKDVISYDITQTVCDPNICHALSESAKKLDKKAKIHVKIDTGMGRIGVACDGSVDLIKRIIQLPNIIVDGVYTHFSVADEDKCYTDIQIERFNSILKELKESNINIPIRHSANSAAILNFPSSYYDMVRPGIAIYGLPPCDKPRYPISLKPA